MAKKKVLDAVVKRGRKSKRGRPKTKQEVVKKVPKKQDPVKLKNFLVKVMQLIKKEKL